MNEMLPAIKFQDNQPAESDFAAEVLAGLRAEAKHVSPKFFYDEKGSKLFDAICQTPEYYPTRTEAAIIHDNVEDIARYVGQGSLLVEPGSGNSAKVRRILDAIRPHAYLPMDISKAFLQQEACKLAVEFPWLDVHAVCTDFTVLMDISQYPENVKRVAFFPGSSIGNFEPLHAQAFMSRIKKMVGTGGGLLIGVDMKKDPALLNAAYNDSDGFTAAFNKNMLEHINCELDANFDIDTFFHMAFYNEEKGRIEMHLESACDQEVRVGDEVVSFTAGETIHTENSYKYSPDEFAQLASGAGFELETLWTDDDRKFSLFYFRAL